jgi:FKBP-type peptidyl-prolyl cis-trans isomerase (trigger factor)
MNTRYRHGDLGSEHANRTSSVVNGNISEEATLNITVETTPQSDAQFHLQLSWNEIDKKSEDVYRRLAKEHKFPGFRPGKAPRALVERAL